MSPHTLFQKIVTSIVTVCFMATSLVVPAAHASVPVCNDAYAADAGLAPECGAVRINGAPIAYPKLKWAELGTIDINPASSTAITPGDESEHFGNAAAKLLGLSASEVATAVSFFPSNLPYVFARYDPIDYTLRIDIFKVEKVISGGEKRAVLLHAVFGPEHGNFWRASRSYIHPEDFRAALTPGLNPFAIFAKNEDRDIFHNISMNGAQVATGHAMRYAGAPFSVFAVADPRLSQKKKKSGNAIRKKVTIYIYGHAKTKWFMGQPVGIMNGSSTASVAAFCAPNPDSEDCKVYETASAGVIFDEFDGGNLSNFEDQLLLYKKSQSGWGFLAVLIVAVIGSFIISGLLGALGIGGGTGGAAGVGGSTGAMTGTFGSFLVNGGYIASFNTIVSSVAVEALFTAAKIAIISGANLGSMLTMGGDALLGTTTVMKGSAIVGDVDEYVGKLNQQLVAPSTTSDFAQGGKTLTGFGNTIIGDCPPGNLSSSCTTGAVPRQDQYDEHNTPEFLKEYSPYLVRDTNPQFAP